MRTGKPVAREWTRIFGVVDRKVERVDPNPLRTSVHTRSSTAPSNELETTRSTRRNSKAIHHRIHRSIRVNSHDSRAKNFSP